MICKNFGQKSEALASPSVLVAVARRSCARARHCLSRRRHSDRSYVLGMLRDSSSCSRTVELVRVRRDAPWGPRRGRDQSGRRGCLTLIWAVRDWRTGVGRRASEAVERCVCRLAAGESCAIRREENWCGTREELRPPMSELHHQRSWSRADCRQMRIQYMITPHRIF